MPLKASKKPNKKPSKKPNKKPLENTKLKSPKSKGDTKFKLKSEPVEPKRSFMWKILRAKEEARKMLESKSGEGFRSAKSNTRPTGQVNPSGFGRFNGPRRRAA